MVDKKKFDNAKKHLLDTEQMARKYCSIVAMMTMCETGLDINAASEAINKMAKTKDFEAAFQMQKVITMGLVASFGAIVYGLLRELNDGKNNFNEGESNATRH